MNELNDLPFQLFTVAGSAAITVLILQTLIKPALADRKDTWKWYRLTLNLLAVVFGVGFSLLGAIIVGETIDGVTFGVALVRGIVAGSLAIGGYETVKNMLGGVSSGE